MTRSGGDSPKLNFEEESFGEDMNEKEIQEIGRRRTRLMTAVERRELERDKTSGFRLRMENTGYYKDCTVYTVKVPVAEHGKAEVKEDKRKELENIMKYGVYEEVEDYGQEIITLRWVITQKEKVHGQKTESKGKVVAQGFQE